MNRKLEIGISNAKNPAMYYEFVEWNGNKKRVVARREARLIDDVSQMASNWIRYGIYDKTVH